MLRCRIYSWPEDCHHLQKFRGIRISVLGYSFELHYCGIACAPFVGLSSSQPDCLQQRLGHELHRSLDISVVDPDRLSRWLTRTAEPDSYLCQPIAEFRARRKWAHRILLLLEYPATCEGLYQRRHDV